MSQDSSFVGAFDLNSQTGVMSILASIRASTISPAEKNELRDLVFLYTNGGGDASVRISLEQKLANHHIAPVAVKQTASAGPALAFGSYRPTPTFKKPAAASVTNQIPPVVSVVPPQPVTVVMPVVAPVIPATPIVTPATNIAVPVAPVPIAPVPIAPVPIAPVPAPDPAPVAAPLPVTPMPAPAVATGSTPEAAYLERIRQIKTAVNSKVGNPVNLVDINNEVGREYMNALLEAMKKLSSGAVSEMEPVMARLESAFKSVEVAIAGHKNPVANNPVAVIPPTPTPASVAAPTIPVQTASIPVRVVPVPNVVASEVQPPQSQPRPVSMTLPPVTVVPPKVEVPIPRPEFNKAPTPTPAPTPVAAAVSVPTPVPVRPVPTPNPTPAAQPVPAASSFPDAAQNTSGSLAEKQRILTPRDLPDAASLSTGDKGDPLFTKEVDDGLDQLLADWTLFKKSGLFGTGAKGREHPLFKKISDLQVPLLLAGRFDGANQEIRQSITDYMNGWRYEQGIIYQPGETFERYLRRVIKHIIDLQKKHKHS